MAKKLDDRFLALTNSCTAYCTESAQVPALLIAYGNSRIERAVGFDATTFGLGLFNSPGSTLSSTHCVGKAWDSLFL